VNGGSQHPDKRRAGGHGPTLADQIEQGLLPTPRASDTQTPGYHGQGGQDLRTIVDSLESEPRRLLPSPRASDGEKGGPNQRGSSGDLMLPSAVMPLLPTPAAADGSGGRYGSDGHQTPLPGAVRMLPTPTSRDHKGRNQRDDTTCLPGALLPTPTAMDSESSGGAKPKDVTLTDATVRNPDRWGEYAPAIHRWEAPMGRPAPDPTQTSTQGNPQLAPPFVEWMMGLPAGHVTDVPDMTRNEMLKALGNGVVPQQVAAALEWILTVGVTAWKRVSA
jgi:DNA (cytosine-5)-methyltransferase 1